VSRPIELLTSDQFSEPVAFGLIDWRIALPTSLDAGSSPDEIDALLAHEIAHLRRGDIVWLHVGRLLTTCLAFQPLNFLARRKWQLHAEFQCDDWAVAQSVDAVSLARSLTFVAELRSAPALANGALPAGGRRSHITQRVERLLTGRTSDVWSGRLWRVVLLILGITITGVLTTHGPTTGASAGSILPVTIEMTSAGGDDVSLTPDDATEERALQTDLSLEVAGLSGDLDALTHELELLQPLLVSLPPDSALRDPAERLQRRIGQLREATSDGAVNQ